MTISLVTDAGVKSSKYFEFFISKEESRTHNFHYDKFSNTGKYSNLNLFQYSEEIDWGNHVINVHLKTDKEQTIQDSLEITPETKRVEIFVFISTSDSTGDYVREIRTLKYQANSDHLRFMFETPPKLGSFAEFSIKNASNKTFIGYPNAGFFFGTLYEEIRNDGWTQHYPLYIHHTFCDTITLPNPLLPKQSRSAWTPNSDNCTAFKFVKTGSYFFELLYTESNTESLTLQGSTKIRTFKVYRQIFEFNI
ncbi:MAG: hypothetical protein EOO46_20680 [Flavobacterium sp.]|nr:MAG: hypothetical protein EOO46_20680 [Flavobacterium sp.]